ncbi:MAG: tetratricopeptide repeat protein [Cyanobacteria bacterium SZAS-4]|nr:tetratricopeptide repeat protein [Cyanobacteria bacterium SZAS-4]
MFRPSSLLTACAASVVSSACFASYAAAQSAQYPAPNPQLALATPNANGGMQMLRSEASMLFSSGQFSAAAENYKRLLQLGSTDANDRYWLGESIYRTGNYQHAATAFEQAIQLDKKMTQAYIRLAESYLALHQRERALQTCKAGLDVVTDPYMKEQLSNLLKVSFYQERKPTRSRDVRVGHFPSES